VKSVECAGIKRFVLTAILMAAAKLPFSSPQSGRPKSSFAGRRIFFCSEHCLHKFETHPKRYPHEETHEAQDPPVNGEPKASVYTCPMHVVEKAFSIIKLALAFSGI
jgi:YHS domain-containing protein